MVDEPREKNQKPKTITNNYKKKQEIQKSTVMKIKNKNGIFILHILKCTLIYIKIYKKYSRFPHS